MRQHSVVVTWQVTYRKSVEALHRSYDVLENFTALQNDSRFDRLLAGSEQETANSLEVINSIISDDEQDVSEDVLADQKVSSFLQSISPDLDSRWSGAVFALSPKNPDTARHFCTSAREIFATILEIKAPDEKVSNTLPDCERTDRGTPTRRAKLKYFLHLRGIAENCLEEFIENDMENIVQLFKIFNSGTHGSAGAVGLPQLYKLKKRIEQGIAFLAEVIGDGHSSVH